jgi:hypothetical protein
MESRIEPWFGGDTVRRMLLLRGVLSPLNYAPTGSAGVTAASFFSPVLIR